MKEQIKGFSLTTNQKSYPIWEEIISQKDLVDYSIDLIKASKKDIQQNVRVSAVYDSNCNLKLDKKCDPGIRVGTRLEENFRPIFYQVFDQLIGYRNALKKGINPTNPKNLDYYVTF